jgi:hypothetical protein
MKIYFFALASFLFLAHNRVVAQTTKEDEKNKSTQRIIPRFGIGFSKHVMAEVGFGYSVSNFSNHEKLGLNTAIRTIYASYEAVKPFSSTQINGYKVGAEINMIGHVTSSGGLELAYYERPGSASVALIPKIGIPLFIGSLTYGLSMQSNSEMRKEIGRHRLTLVVWINRKNSKVLGEFLKKG